MKYCKLLSKLSAALSEFTVVERARSKLISESFELKLNSDSSDKRESILKQNFDILVPKYIGTISFALNCLEQNRELTEAPLYLVPG